MTIEIRDYPALLREVRRQLGISQEGLARELGVSFNSINRWENGKVLPSKLARVQLDAFIEKMTLAKKLKIPKSISA